jgi:hypothetical protein
VRVSCDNDADVTYVAKKAAAIAGVSQVMIEEHRVTAVWQEPDEGDSGRGTGG